MTEKKDQKIIVLTSLTDADKSIIRHGIKMAEMFSKELCLAYLMKKKERYNRKSAELKINNYIEQVSKEAPGLKHSVLFIEEPLKHFPETLADKYEAIMIVASKTDYKKYAPAVTESHVPFLFVGTEVHAMNYGKIVLPIDLRKESSDSALWCSWFGRFGKSEVVAIAANDKSTDSQRQVLKNVKMTKTLFQKTGVHHRIIKGRKSSLFNGFEATEYSMASEAGMLVLLGSSTITPLDWLIGLPERKIINRTGSLPVLLINPRRNNYILCD